MLFIRRQVKQAGNAFFKDGRWQRACKKYAARATSAAGLAARRLRQVGGYPSRTFQVLSRAQGARRAQRRGEGEGAQTSLQCIQCGCTGAVKIALQPKPPTGRTHIVSSATRSTASNDYLRLYCVAACCAVMQQVKTDKIAIHNNLATCYSKQRSWCAI